MITEDHLLEHLGRTDVYLIDQFMKRRFGTPLRVLDAGCGSGRNLDLFLRGGYEVWVADQRAAAVQQACRHAASLRCDIPAERSLVGAVEELELPPGGFDVVLSIAVLHFARDPAHWRAIVEAMWGALAPGGTLFARLCSSIGIEAHVTSLGDGRYVLGDGSERLLVSLDELLRTTDELGAELLEPVKTVNVQNLRCMTTWVMRKPA